MAFARRSSRLTNVKVTNLNSEQQKESAFQSIESPQEEIPMKRNEEIQSVRWKPTDRQIDILQHLYKEGERNPNRDREVQIANMLKVHGDIEAKNVHYWFQNAQWRNRQKQQMNLEEKSREALNEREVAGSSQASVCSSRDNAPTVIWEPSMGLAHFSSQEVGNSRPSACSTARETVCSAPAVIWEPSMGFAQFSSQEVGNSRPSTSSSARATVPPTNFLIKQHLQFAENETLCNINRANKKQKQEQNSKQEYSMYQKHIAGSSNNPSWSSVTNASSIRAEPAMAMAPLSSHRVIASPESAPHIRTETLLPINLLFKQDLHSADKETVCEAARDERFRNVMLRLFTEDTRRPRGSEAKEHENKGDSLELFPFHPHGNLTSKGRPQYWDGLFTDPRGSNVNKDELLELFPLHRHGNLRSRPRG